ncbi:MAG: response regulator, partial [Candidatus Dadabacteria bacterium]
LEQLVEKAVQATREFGPGAAVAPAEKRRGHKSRPTVMVVDDVSDARMILSVYLSKTGYQVVTAASAEDCLAKLRYHDVDAIVLDARMPGADARHVCRVLAEDPAFAGKRRVPVIVYTGYPDEYGREEVLSWGAADYVIKGGDMLPLITALIRHTQQASVEQRL